MQVTTKKYKVTLRDPNTEVETVQIATEEPGGITIEQAFGTIGMDIVGKELLETMEENVQKLDPSSGIGPNQEPQQVQRRVIKNGEAPVQYSGNTGNVKQPAQTNVSYSPPKERIIKRGDIRLKLVGDQVFTEDWVECTADDYKIINNTTGKPIKLSSVVLLHKEWVEILEEEEDEDLEMGELAKEVVAEVVETLETEVKQPPVETVEDGVDMEVEIDEINDILASVNI